MEPFTMTQEPTPTVTELVATIPVFERDDKGMVKGVSYFRRPDGRIQWEKHIKHEHIVFNSKLDAQLEKIYGAPARDLNYAAIIASGKEVDPKHVLVLLMGLIELAEFRGYSSALPRIAHVCSWPLEAAISVCEHTIDWIPNEEDPDGKTSSGCADATMDNTGGWGYLTAMAENRSFCRAVRRGLRIPIMSFDEIAKKDTVIPESAPQVAAPKNIATATLEKHATAGGLTFEAIKTGALERYREKMEGDPSTWTKWDDIGPRDCTTLLKLIRDKAKNK